MFKKSFLFATTILAATAVSTGYGSTDSLKGNVNPATFLDWFNSAAQYVPGTGLVVLDLIPILFLAVQAILFFKDAQKTKGFLTIFAILSNVVGALLIIQYAAPIASQIAGWTPENLPADWVTTKDSWLQYIDLSGLVSIFGWLAFVTSYFLPRKNTALKPLPGFFNFLKNGVLFFLTFLLGMSMSRLYDFCFFPVSYDISATTFIEMHRPMDLAIRKVGPVLFAIIFSMHLILAGLFFLQKTKNKAWLIAAAALFLLCDTFIALQYNGPINDLFLTWTPTTIPDEWAITRNQWLRYHMYRDIFMIFGFTCILLTFFVKPTNAAAKTV